MCTNQNYFRAKLQWTRDSYSIFKLARREWWRPYLPVLTQSFRLRLTHPRNGLFRNLLRVIESVPFVRSPPLNPMDERAYFDTLRREDGVGDSYVDS